MEKEQRGEGVYEEEMLGKRKVGRGTQKKNKEGKEEKIIGRRQRERVVEEGREDDASKGQR